MTANPGGGDVDHTGHERVTTMQRVRRLTCSAVVAAVALTGLAACRSEPGVAAYLGDRTITTNRVDAVYADARTKLDAAVEQIRAEQQGKAPATPAQLPITRQDVLTTLLGVDVLKAYAQRKGVSPAAVSAQQVVQEIPLPPDAQYVQSVAEYRGYLTGLSQAAKPAELTRDDLRDVFVRLDRAGVFDQAEEKPSLQAWVEQLNPRDRALLQQVVGLRNELAGEVRSLRASVNPRFGAGELPLLPFADAKGRSAPLVVLPLAASAGQSAVSDR